MITSVAVQAYLTRIRALFKEQGFDDSMRVVYDSENEMADTWLSDELADKEMRRKQMTVRDDVRSGPFMCLFWTRTSLTPIVRQRYRLLDTNAEGGPAGKSTVSASFKIACAFVSNKAEAVEDLEEAFAAVFQNTYNMPLSLEYIYNSEYVKDKTINFTYIQNMGEADLVNFKEGNLFAYGWSATIYMNYVSEFAWSRVYPVEKLVIDLYDPKGFPISSLDQFGKAQTHTYTAVDGTEVPNVPDEPLVAFTSADPRDYAPFSITLPYSVPYDDGSTPRGQEPPVMPSAYDISDEARVLIESAIKAIGGEVSLNSTRYMIVVRMPLSLNHAEGADHDADMAAVSNAIKQAIGEEYVVTPMHVES
jgi:hypothetical protein